MTRAHNILLHLHEQEEKKNYGNTVKKVGTSVGGGLKKVGAVIAKDHERGNEMRHTNKLKRIERRKEKLQAKAELKQHKKRLKADMKLYKYNPLIH
jgi:pantothenate kinase